MRSCELERSVRLAVDRVLMAYRGRSRRREPHGVAADLEDNRQIAGGNARTRVTDPVAVDPHAALLDLPAGVARRGGKTGVHENAGERP